MSSEKQGWLSAVSRIFSGGQQSTGGMVEQNPVKTQHSSKKSDLNSVDRNFSAVNGGYTPTRVAESCSGPPRNLRYLSPSALETSASQPSVSKPPVLERNFLLSTTSRKRVLTQDDPPSALVDTFPGQDNPKRSKREQFATSMLENVTPRLLLDHLDSRLNRTVGVPSSSMEFLHSPISNRSLIERIGSNRSNASSLSSKTRAILNHLERINTPAREARKLPVMRGSNLPSERWAPMNSSAGAPPLLRSNANVPSRIQLLSATLASQRKPYWRDITRKAKDKEASVSPKGSDGKSGDNSVHPLFDMDNPSSFRVDSCKSSKTLQGNVESELNARNGPSVEELTEVTKKSVGSNYRESTTNVFNAKKLFDEEVLDSQDDIPVFAPPTEAAPSENRDDIVFKFDAPVERQLGQCLDEDDDFTLVEHGESRNTSEDSSDSDSDDEQESSVSEAEEANVPVKGEKNSRPSTAADSETSADVSAVITPISSKDVSPQTKTETWNCPECFITNKNVTLCAACGYKKDAAVASKSLFTNVTASVKPAANSGMFAIETTTGCRTGSAEKRRNILEPPSSKSIEIPTPAVGKPDSPSVPTSSQVSVINVAHESGAERRLEIGGSEKERKDWECPDCMASNNKCVCCGHVMYKCDETQTSSSVFGERAFKTGTAVAKFSFGFGGSNNTASTSGPIKFGFGASDVVKSAPTSTDSSIKSATIPPGNSNSVLSSETGKDTFANTPPKLEGTAKSTESQPPAFAIGAGAAPFGSEPRPPLFDSSAFKSSSLTGSSLPASTTSTFSNTKTLADGSSSQAVSNSSPKPFVFGTVTSTNLTGQSGFLSAKSAENHPSSTPPFGSGLKFGTLPNSDAKTLSSTTNTSGSNAEATGVVPSTSVNIFGTGGAAKPVFPSFGITSESSKPFMNTNTSTESLKASPFEMNVSTSTEVQKPLFGISGTTSVSKPLFGAGTSSTFSNSNGGLSFNFGSTNTFGAFGTAATTVSSSLPPASSNTSIFGSATNAPEAPKPFQFNTTLSEPVFQFGQAPLTGSTPFQFGSSQQAAPAAPSFQASGISSCAAPSSNFTFTSNNTRKMVSARRRLPQRK